MPPVDEKNKHVFTHRELAEMLIRKKDLHEGIWGLYIEFGLAGVNAGPNDESLNPAAVVGISAIGLQRFEKETNLSVDAAKVNPVRPKGKGLINTAGERARK